MSDLTIKTENNASLTETVRHEVKNNITASGALNCIMGSVVALEENDYKFIMRREPCGVYDGKDIVVYKKDSTIRFIHPGSTDNKDSSNKTYLNVTYTDKYSRDQMNPRAKDKGWHQATVQGYRLLAICKDIKENSYNTRDDYDPYDGNHMVPTSYERSDSYDNLELCSKSENYMHWIAWSKIMDLVGGRFRLRLSALDHSTIKFVKNKDTYCSGKHYDWSERVAQIMKQTCSDEEKRQQVLSLQKKGFRDYIAIVNDKSTFRLYLVRDVETGIWSVA